MYTQEMYKGFRANKRTDERALGSGQKESGVRSKGARGAKGRR